MSLLLVLSLAPGSLLHAQQYLFDHYTTADGLPSNTAYRCTGDKEGFIWIATSGGVARFDGKTFDVFHEQDGLPDDDIVYLLADSHNRIWFSGFNGNMSFRADNSMHTSKTDKRLQALQAGGFVQYGFEDPAHNLFFVYSNGRICCITAAGNIAFAPVTGNLFFTRHATWFLPDSNGSKGDHFLHHFVNDSRISIPDSFLRKTIGKQSIELSRHGTLCVMKQHDVYLTAADSFSLQLIYHSSRLLTRAKYICDSCIILFSPGNGGYIFNTLQRRVTHQLLPGETLTDAYMNARGDLWCTSLNNGLFYLPACRGKAAYLTSAEHLANEKCTAVFPLTGNSIWAGMDNAMLQQFTNGRLVRTVALSDNPKAFGRINAIACSPAGYLGIASDAGMFLMNKDGTHLKQVSFNTSEKKNTQLSAVKTCTVAPNGDFLIAVTAFAQRLPVAEMRKDNPAAIQAIYSPGRVLCAYEDSHRRMWYATGKGLCLAYGHDTIAMYQRYAALRRRIFQIKETKDGYIILATDGAGIIILKDEKIYAGINTGNGLPGNICRKIFVAGDTIYTATPEGIGIITRNENNHIAAMAVTGKDGLLSVDCRDVCVSGGQLYAATDKGISILNLDGIYHTGPVPRSYLRSITVDGNTFVPGQEQCTFRYGIKSIIVSYGAVLQDAAAGVEYRYRTSAGSGWIVTSASSFVYNDPAPQQLQVTIQSRYRGGQWDKGVVLSILIRPRFYQEIWFLILAVCLLVAVICSSIVIYYRKQRQQLYNRNRLAKLESQASQAMMNPHFVFNALNSVQHFINGHNSYAANQYLTRFSRLIRRHLELNRRQYISLEEEFDFLRLYLEIEKSRCDDKLSFVICVSENIQPDEVFIPVLILQPLAENAVWHGITPKEEGGCIHITASTQAGQLYITVTDNGVGFPAEALQQERQSMGLSIIKDRLHLLSRLYNREFSIRYKNTSAGNTEIVVCFPMLGPNDLITVI